MNNTTSTTNTRAPTAAPNKAPQKKRRVRRVPTFTTDESGRALVLVPLPDRVQQVRILHEDFDRISDRYAISCQWQYNNKGGAHSYVRVKLSEAQQGVSDWGLPVRPTHAVIARLILDVSPSVIVRYRDGDRLNLVRENLYTEEDDSPRSGKKPAHPMNVKKFAQSVLRFDPD